MCSFKNIQLVMVLLQVNNVCVDLLSIAKYIACREAWWLSICWPYIIMYSSTSTTVCIIWCIWCTLRLGFLMSISVMCRYFWIMNMIRVKNLGSTTDLKGKWLNFVHQMTSLINRHIHKCSPMQFQSAAFCLKWVDSGDADMFWAAQQA